MTTAFDISQLYRFGPKAKVTGLDTTFAQRLHALLSAAPGNVEIFSGYRSPQRQAEILRSGLAKRGLSTSRWDSYVQQAGGDVVRAGEMARPWLRSTGITKWIAPPGASFHQRGKAADLRYASDDVRSWVHSNAPKFGLHFPMGHEPWHIEPVGSRSRGGFAAKALDQSNAPVNLGSSPKSGPTPSTQPSVPAGPGGGQPPATAAGDPNALYRELASVYLAALEGGGMPPMPPSLDPSSPDFSPTPQAPVAAPTPQPTKSREQLLEEELAEAARSSVATLQPSMARGFIGAFFG